MFHLNNNIPCQMFQNLLSYFFFRRSRLCILRNRLHHEQFIHGKIHIIRTQNEKRIVRLRQIGQLGKNDTVIVRSFAALSFFRRIIQRIQCNFHVKTMSVYRSVKLGSQCINDVSVRILFLRPVIIRERSLNRCRHKRIHMRRFQFFEQILSRCSSLQYPFGLSIGLGHRDKAVQERNGNDGKNSNRHQKFNQRKAPVIFI